MAKLTATYQEVIDIFAEHTKGYNLDEIQPNVRILKSESSDIWYSVSFSFKNDTISVCSIVHDFKLNIEDIKGEMTRTHPDFEAAITKDLLENFLKAHYLDLYKHLGSKLDYTVIVDKMYNGRGSTQAKRYNI